MITTIKEEKQQDLSTKMPCFNTEIIEVKDNKELNRYRFNLPEETYNYSKQIERITKAGNDYCLLQGEYGGVLNIARYIKEHIQDTKDMGKELFCKFARILKLEKRLCVKDEMTQKYYTFEESIEPNEYDTTDGSFRLYEDCKDIDSNDTKSRPIPIHFENVRLFTKFDFDLPVNLIIAALEKFI